MSSTVSSPSQQANTTAFEVYVAKDTFKFNAAHFVAFEGYRERLHGHNYRVGVRLLGQKKIGGDGYLIDFGNVKKVVVKVCKRLNEHFICPIYSNVLTITTRENDDKQSSSVHVECSVDGSKFVFPENDCVMLPIVHATAEEMAIFLYAEILNGLNADYLLQRGIHTMEVTVAEAVGQEAVFRLAIPEPTSGDGSNGSFQLDVRNFITEGKVVAMPCLVDSEASVRRGPVGASITETNASTCATNSNCVCSTHWSEQLTRLAQAINDGSIQNDGTPVSVDSLQQFLAS